MAHTKQHTQRQNMQKSRENLRIKKDKIAEFRKNNEGFSYREAEIELFEGGIPTVTLDNGDKVKLELVRETKYRDSSKGKKADGFIEYYTDGKGNQYDKEGNLTKRAKDNPPPVNFDDIRKKRLARYGKRRQGGVLRYPAELLTEHTDYLQIDIERYAEIGKTYVSDTGGSSRYVIGNASQNRAGRTKKLSRRPLINAGTILLPIPAQ